MFGLNNCNSQLNVDKKQIDRVNNGKHAYHILLLRIIESEINPKEFQSVYTIKTVESEDENTYSSPAASSPDTVSPHSIDITV